MAPRPLGLVITLLALWHSSVDAEEWSRARIARLPDSAFAVIEIAPNGKKVRHLPHHDETGAVNRAHLRAALARLPQVKWRDPANKAIARRHLEDHLHETSPKQSGDAVERVIQFGSTTPGTRDARSERGSAGTTARVPAHPVQRPR